MAFAFAARSGAGWRQGFDRRMAMKITRTGTTPSAKGPAEWFTGQVRMDQAFANEDPSRLRGALVTFEPGARTAWHTHPLGQLLIVTAGFGRAQAEGGPVQVLRPGDMVWFGPEERHWHGASPSTALTHLALQEAKDVSDADYAAEPV
jgi:quercetin dioxygenase-like cupin family protein